jgi:uncharacterized protein YbjT (DUF2867 family)
LQDGCEVGCECVRWHRISWPPCRALLALPRVPGARRRAAFSTGNGALRPAVGSLHFIAADVHDERAVDAAIDGAQAVINTVSLYAEHAKDTFHSVHVVAAARIASCAASAGVQRLVHVSGVGANASSPLLYIRKRGEGGAATRAAFSGACLVRPTVMFGDRDRFLTPLCDLIVRLRVFPLFGRGMTRLQPVHVVDVAGAIAQLAKASRQLRLHSSSAAPASTSIGKLSAPLREAQAQILFFSLFRSECGMRSRY